MYFFRLLMLFVFTDLITKYHVVTQMETLQITFLNLFSFWYMTNPGIAFGLPITGLFLQILTIILIFGIFWYYYREVAPLKKRILDLSFALILWGAIGNGIERLFFGEVTDFLGIRYFAVFNLADIFLTFWAIIFIFYHHKNGKLLTK